MKIKEKVKGYLYSFLAITAVWYVIALIIKLPIVPSPFDVYITLGQIFIGKIAIHVYHSMIRILEGIAISLLLGVTLGLLMGSFKTMDRIMSPLVYFTYPIPKIALLPVVMLLFGMGEVSKVLMIVIIIIFQVIITARDAVKAIPGEVYHFQISLGASKFQIFKEIVVPATFPDILTSTRLALGTAVSILFFTETFGTEYGMGYFIMDAWMRVNYLEMYAGIAVLSIIGLAVFALIDIIEYYFCSWR